MGIPIGGKHLELMFAVDLGDFDDGNVEGSAPEVVHGHLDISVFSVQTESHGCSRGFIDDPLDFESGDAAGVLRSLALGIVEIGRHGNNGFLNFFTQEGFGILLQFHQNTGGYFRWGHLFAVDLNPGVTVIGLGNLIGNQMDVLLDDGILEAPPNKTFDRIERILRIGDGLALGGLSYQHFVIRGISDD